MTTYYDYYLRGSDRDTTRAALLAAGIVIALPSDEERLCDLAADGFAVDEIGSLQVGGEWGPDGDVITAPTAVPGWHVNLRLARWLTDAEKIALAGILEDPGPVTPYRVWA